MSNCISTTSRRGFLKGAMAAGLSAVALGAANVLEVHADEPTAEDEAYQFGYELHGVLNKRFTVERDGLKINGVIRAPETIYDGPVPTVVLMHGCGGSMQQNTVGSLAEGLPALGIATVIFDFDGHGTSDGTFEEHTVPGWIADAETVIDYVRQFPWVGEIALAGHSQGGVTAGLVAGRNPEEFAALVLMAPAGSIEDNVKRGYKCGIEALGDEYMRTGCELNTYEVSANYQGPVLIIGGKVDGMIPNEYFDKYHEIYENDDYILLANEDHGLQHRLTEVIDFVTAFLRSNLLD